MPTGKGTYSKAADKARAKSVKPRRVKSSKAKSKPTKPKGLF